MNDSQNQQMDAIHLCRKSMRWSDTETAAASLAAFSPSQSERYLGLNGARQTEYLISRTLIRCALWQQFGLSPSDYQFQEEPKSAPKIIHPSLKIHLSLSHSQHFVVCALSDAVVGIDIEEPREVPHLRNIAQRIFTPSQLQRLMQIKARRRPAQFLNYWAQKEAVYKACSLAGEPIKFIGQNSAANAGFNVAHYDTNAFTAALASRNSSSGFSCHYWFSPSHKRPLTPAIDSD